MLNRILGGLYGQALGDAWAMPALLTPEDTWQRYGGWIGGFLPGPPDHPVHSGLAAGRITDDTEQAFALAEAIIQDGRVTVEGAARAIVAWYERIGGDDCPYVGPSTRRAVQAIQRGHDLHTTGRHGDTNGAAMRIAPVGLIHPGDLEGAVADTALACAPTHNTDVAISGAAAVAGAIAIALRPDATLDEIVQAGQEAAKLGRAYGNRWMGASVARRIELASGIARQPWPERERIQELYELIGTSLAIPESVPAAFGVLVMAARATSEGPRQRGVAEQAAIFAAALSGDADTIGAMACAIAGAWRGVEDFEPAILRQLEAANPELDFQGVARQLAAIAGSATGKGAAGQ